MNGRNRGVAEVEVVHRDASGNVKSIENTKMPVSFVFDKNGDAMDIRKEE
jgi:hypothetical protein